MFAFFFKSRSSILGGFSGAELTINRFVDLLRSEKNGALTSFSARDQL